MTTKSEGASVPASQVDEFLKDDPNTITSSDVSTPIKQAPVIQQPPPPDKNPGKSEVKSARRSWRSNFVAPQGLHISRLMLPPITRRKTATYETLQESRFDPRIIQGDNAIAPPPISLPPTYAIFDRGEQDFSIANKMMKNVVRSEVRQIRGSDNQLRPQVEEVLEYVDFTNGHKMVNIETEYILYAFLELHPLNASNKFRDKSKKPLFRRTDFDYKSSHIQMLEMDLQDEAVRYVMKLTEKELINLASAMSNPTVATINVPTSDIRYNMRLRARNNPEEVLFKSPDKKASTRIDVIHALEMQVLDYLPERNSYFLTGDDRTPFFECQVDANPLEDISKYLSSSEGREDYDAMMEYVNFWKE